MLTYTHAMGSSMTPGDRANSLCTTNYGCGDLFGSSELSTGTQTDRGMVDDLKRNHRTSPWLRERRIRTR